MCCVVVVVVGRGPSISRGPYVESFKFPFLLSCFDFLSFFSFRPSLFGGGGDNGTFWSSFFFLRGYKQVFKSPS